MSMGAFRIRRLRFSDKNGWLAVLVTLIFVNGVIYVLSAQHPWLYQDDASDYFKGAQFLLAWLNGTADSQSWTDFGRQLARAPLFTMMNTAIYTVVAPWFGDAGSLQAIRLANVLMLTLDGVLMYWLAIRIGLKKFWASVGVAALLLYFPLLYATGQILTEIQTGTLLLVGVYFWLSRRPVWSAVFIMLALSNNYYSMWIRLILLLISLGLIFFLSRGNRTWIWRFCLAMVVFGLGFTGLHLALPHLEVPFTNVLAFADTGGWLALQSQNSGLHLPADWPSWSPWVLILHLALPLLKTMALNAVRFLGLANNIYREHWLGMPPSGLVLYQRFLAWMVLGTLPLQIFKRKSALLFGLIGIYLLTCSAYHIELRYSLVIMPIFILLACHGAALCFRLDRKTGWWMLGVSMLLAVLPLFRDAVLSLGMSLWQWRLQLLIVGVCLMTLLVEREMRITKRFRKLRHFRLMQSLAVALLALGGVCISLTLLGEPDTQPWHVKLTPARKIERLIPIPAGFEETEATYLVLETDPYTDKQGTSLSLTVNGLLLPTRWQSPPGLQGLNYARGGLVSADDFPQYRYLELSSSMRQSILRHGSADIRLRGEGMALAGDYPWLGSNQFWIPHPDYGYFSMFKLIAEQEGRMPALVTAFPDSSSELLEEGRLAEKPNGHFRIFLIQIPTTTRTTDFPYLDRSPALPKQLRLWY